MNNYIICLIGISGSGKSTFAQHLCEIDSTYLIVNRDKIRELLFGYSEQQMSEYYKNDKLKKREGIVTQYEYKLIREHLLAGYNVIVDATHLKLEYINKLKSFNHKITFKLFDEDYNVCVERDKHRNRSVGESVILKQYQSLLNLKQKFDFKDWEPDKWTVPEYDDNKPDIYCFDIDGTLARKSNRSPYDWKRVCEDTINNDVAKTLVALQIAGYYIAIVTGRDGCCEVLTKQWLDEHGIDYDEYYQRKAGDTRPDYVVKQEFWQDISSKYNIVANFDDRQGVVDFSRACGIPTYQVNYGDF